LQQVNALVLARGEYYRLLSAAFLHGGPLHLLGNMLTLHFIAPELERIVGRGCFLALYLAGAVGGGAMHLWMGHMGSMLMGASGKKIIWVVMVSISALRCSGR
jgi:membrane associated rhomboid family serine protease